MSWEYPPILVGGLGRHVADLAGALAAAGHDVRVLTRGRDARASFEQIAGVGVLRAAADPVAVDLATESLLAFIATMEHALIRAAVELLDGWRPDVVHGHDWMVAHTVRTVSARWRCPSVVTMHATEFGRRQGWLDEPLPRAIHSIERWMCRDADAVIGCSQYMARQLRQVFDLPATAVAVIGNGIDPDMAADPQAVRAERARGGAGPHLMFAGRLVHEKGLQELIKALPRVAAVYPGVRLTVAGSGPQLDDQRDRADRYGVTDRIDWRGRLDGGQLAAVMAAADIVVVPSLYEPFGLVALEAQALGTPVAVSDTGGLVDLVTPGLTGERFAPQDPAAIAEAVLRLLGDPGRAAALAATARDAARSRYDWGALAQRTAAVYNCVQRPSSSTR